MTDTDEFDSEHSDQEREFYDDFANFFANSSSPEYIL